MFAWFSVCLKFLAKKLFTLVAPYFGCNFLDLPMKQSSQGISCDIFDKRSQPEYEGIEMIHMPHVHSSTQLLLSWELSTVHFTGF
jgi:hypothetical protein